MGVYDGVDAVYEAVAMQVSSPDVVEFDHVERGAREYLGERGDVRTEESAIVVIEIEKASKGLRGGGIIVEDGEDFGVFRDQCVLAR
jgi:hypothetical protein